MPSGRDHLHGDARRVAERVSAVLDAGRGPADAQANEATDDVPVSPGSGPEPGAGMLDRLTARLPTRLDPGRRSIVAIALVVAVVAAITGTWVFVSRPRTMPVSTGPSLPGASPLVASPGSARSTATPGSTGVSPATSAATEVVVDVAGKVRSPGLYRLAPGSRVDDAIKAAGGALRGVDLATLNLAAPLIDGQQIAVGRAGASAPPAGGATGSGGASAAAGGSGGLVNLNTASLGQLDELPGIGPALAQRILDFRTQHGSFASVDQLDDVSGIGTVIFARLKTLVSV